MRFLMVLFLVLNATLCSAADSAGTSWTTFADCSAAYRANWQDRLTDPDRAPEMRDSIQSQADDYKKAAAHLYSAEHKVSLNFAQQHVEAYIVKNTARFIAMDKAGKLNSFIDRCPQIEAE